MSAAVAWLAVLGSLLALAAAWYALGVLVRACEPWWNGTGRKP